jgi:hypothetical protein
LEEVNLVSIEQEQANCLQHLEYSTSQQGREIAASPVAGTASFYRQQFFFGPFGLRAVWSLLIYFAILIPIAVGLNAAHHHIEARHNQAAAQASLAAPKATRAQPYKMSALISLEASLFAVLLPLS